MRAVLVPAIAINEAAVSTILAQKVAIAGSMVVVCALVVVLPKRKRAVGGPQLSSGSTR